MFAFSPQQRHLKCAIYRGPGGSGDATADSANTAQVAETFATQAGVSAAAAAASAIDANAAKVAAEAAQAAAELAETNAETAETNAETAETNAETAQTAAENARDAALAAQTAAELAETNAETAETNAETAQAAAEAAQLAAETAQTAAELAETNAETAETGALAAQAAAESARDSALAAYDNFDDRYLGAKTSDPTLDNDGNALVAGALYFNSVDGAMRVYTGSVWVDAYAAGTSFLAKANNLSDLPNVATARQNLDLEIGVDVQAYDATILKSADIGVTVQGYDANTLKSGDIGVTVQAYDVDTAKYDDTTANFTGTLQNGGNNVLTTASDYLDSADIGVTVQGYDSDTAKYDDVTANFTGTLQNGGSNVLVDTDIGSTVQAYDATIVVDADIGVTVQGYDADTAKYDDATANFTGTLQNGGSNVLVDTDIGSTVQAYDATIVVDADIGVTVQGYDADTAKYDDVTANFTGTLQNGGSNVLVDSDIGVTVQAYDSTIVVDADIGVTVQGYDADTVKYDDVNPSFTDTGALKLPVGTELQRPGSPTAGQLRFNDDSDEFEGYNGTAWGAIGGGGGGGSGDVTGPASSTDNAIARFDGTTGKIIQNSSITIDDSNVLSGATQINVDNLRLDGNTISSTNTNGDIVLTPNGSGDVQVDADTLRVGDSGVDATIQSNGNADLILKTGNATTGSVTLADGANGNLTVALNGTGQIIINAGAVGTPAIAPTGDTNTGIYFPGADRIGFAEGGAQCGEFDSSANFKFNSGYGSVATAYGCRAWVTFNGTGTPAISEDGNVSSITDHGTGDYTVNFTNAMPDANYSVNTMNYLIPGVVRYTYEHQTIAAGSIRIGSFSGYGGPFVDATRITVSIFR